MTDIVDSEAPPSESPPRTGRRGLLVAVGMASIALVGAGIPISIHLHRLYTFKGLVPPHIGIVGVSPPYTMRIAGNGSDDTAYILTGHAGTHATVAYTIGIAQGPDVSILGLDPEHAAGLADLGWKPLGYNPGHDRARPLPFTFRSRTEIRLAVHVTKPDCTQRPVDYAATDIPVRWTAYGITHTYHLRLSSGSGTELPIIMCPTQQQIRRSKTSA